MNTGELLERVYQDVGHKDRFYVVSLLNEALFMLVWGSGGIEKSALLSVVDGEAIVPSNIITPIMLTGGEFPYDHESIREYGQRHGTFAIFDDLLKINPVQDAELTLLYYGEPEALVEDDDEPEIEPAWHYLLAMYASAMCSVGGKDKGPSDRRLERFESGRGAYNVAMFRKRKRNRVREVNNW